MKRLFALATLLIVLFGGLCFTARAYGYSLPMPPDVQAFWALTTENCPEQPCFLGVVPGRTKFVDVVQIIKRRYRGELLSNVATFEVHQWTGELGRAWFQAGAGGEIAIIVWRATTQRPELPVGWFFAQYGLPCGARLIGSASPWKLELYFQSVIAEMGIYNIADTFYPSDRVISVAFVATLDRIPGFNCHSLYFANKPDIRDWQGFSLSRYLSR